MKKICLDAGHGGRDCGAISVRNNKESYYNLIITKQVELILSKYNCEVVTTRTKDVYLSLQERCNIANNNNCDVFISIHQNSASNNSASGHEIWVYSENTISKSLNLAMKNLKSRDRGIKINKSFTVLKNTKMKSCIVECGFISNDHNEEYIKTNYKDVAISISNGIIKHFNLKQVNCETCGK